MKVRYKIGDKTILQECSSVENTKEGLIVVADNDNKLLFTTPYIGSDINVLAELKHGFSNLTKHGYEYQGELL